MRAIKTSNPFIQSELIFINRLPIKKLVPKDSVIIIDKNLLQFQIVKNWLSQFNFVYPIESGENLKQLKQFEKHLSSILNETIYRAYKTVSFVAVGGGSVGDFVGFMASVYKRGSSLIHIPSTWLAAIDSAHGGKTALNVNNFKNQIGTFYPAQKVLLCKQLLFTQPNQRTKEALGEILKTALLSGSKLWSQISLETQFNSNTIWKYLPQLIDYKYKIVNKDPFEKKGLRFVLNLGHTFGHTFELNFKLPHGIAVNYGLVLALQYSKEMGIIKTNKLKKIMEAPLIKKNLASNLEVLSLLNKQNNLMQLLTQDKKISVDGKINYVFLEAPGHPVVKKVTLSDIISFSKNFKGIS